MNPNIKFSNVDSSLYSKLEEADDKLFKKFTPEEEQQQAVPNPVDTERESKNEGKSFRLLSSTPQITTRKNLLMKYEVPKDKQDGKYERPSDEELRELGNRRIRQMKLEIGKIFSMVLDQQA